MNEDQRQERIEYLKKTLSGLDDMDKEECIKEIRAKFGDQVANHCVSERFNEYARSMLRTTMEQELNQLGE